MNKKKLGSNLAIIIVLTSFAVGAFMPAQAESPFHSVYGFLYIDDELASEDTEVKLEFFDDPEEIPDLIDSYGYYQIDFSDHNFEEGFFFVCFEGDWLIPFDNSSVEIISQEIGYEIDLHINTLGSPPNKPIDPQPENNSVNVSINPTLSVLVTDPDDDNMDVSFYDASDDSLIGTDSNVPSGGTASIQWLGLSSDTEYLWYTVASDSVYETGSDIWNFRTKIIVNQPPNKPTNPIPADGAEDVDIAPFLSVDVTDPDGDNMDVLFFDASDDTLIGIDLNVASGGTASVQWTELSYNKTYSWYAVADDTVYETKSDTWSFTTKEVDNTPPTVSIAKPEKGLYLFDRKILPRFIRPALIIGRITIVANATDEDSGIEKVEFYINGKLKVTDTTAPYEYLWKRDRIRLFHIFVIKVVAYDNEGLEAFDKMLVRKFL